MKRSQDGIQDFPYCSVIGWRSSPVWPRLQAHATTYASNTIYDVATFGCGDSNNGTITNLSITGGTGGIYAGFTQRECGPVITRTE